MKLKVLLFLLFLSSFNLLAQIEIYSPALPFTEKINSRYYEKSPVLHPSGEMLFFVRANDPQNIGGINDAGDIWMSKLDSLGNWGTPVNIGDEVNDKEGNSLIGFLNDGQYMLLADQYGQARYAPRGISISEFRNGKWQAPVNLDIPYFDKKSKHIAGSLSADGNVLILSMESFGSYGVEDLYISERQNNGSWGGLINLGKTINSKYQELTGFLSANNEYLVFSSNRPNGIGSFDLWVAKKQGSSWKKWSEPVLLNDLVNSKGADFDFHYLPQSEYAFFTSTRNSDGYGDIKQVKMKGDSLPEKVTLYLAPNTMILKTKVTDAKSGKPLSANLDITEMNSQKQTQKSSSIYGEASFVVVDDEQLDIKVAKIGYVPIELTLDVKSLSKDSVYQIKLEPLEVGNTVRLEHILFERASDRFLSGSEKELELLYQMMVDNPDVSIFLEGHTDSFGNPKSNQRLSQERVDAVKDYLVSKGIKANRIDGKGFGGTRPIADNSSQETRKLNRRVEFRVTAN
ncbi:MAG: OmpA family protein [Bacteroidota bacterium]